MNNEFENYTIVVTGGSGLFGARLCEHFTKLGAQVVKVNSKSNSSIEQNDIVEIDLQKPDAGKRLSDSLQSRRLTPTHLINCARSKHFLGVDDKGWTNSKDFSDELYFQVVVPYELANHLSDNFSALCNIINVGSIYGVNAVHHKMLEVNSSAPVNYSVAKAGLIQLTKELAIRYRHKGIRVNCISFGGVTHIEPKHINKIYSSLSPSSRMLSIEEVPGAFEFLASSKSRAINGHNLIVDDGWSIV